MTRSTGSELPQGIRIAGKWNRREYVVRRKLGQGANGEVYLVSGESGVGAMKVGFNTLDLQSEINAIRAVHPERGDGAFLMDVDDFSLGKKDFCFYVMKYIEGIPLEQYLRRNGKEWMYPIVHHLLRKLRLLHQRGWIFGDLKPDNVLALDYGHVELVDYGGATAKGKAVKQFTELYDRGYWNAGSRTADEGYDLFSLALLFLHLAGQGRNLADAGLTLRRRNPEYLLELIEDTPALGEASVFLEKAVSGKYRTSTEASAEWLQLMRSLRRPPRPSAGHTLGLSLVFTASLLVCAGIFYWMMQ